MSFLFKIKTGAKGKAGLNKLTPFFVSSNKGGFYLMSKCSTKVMLLGALKLFQ